MKKHKSEFAKCVGSMANRIVRGLPQGYRFSVRRGQRGSERIDTYCGCPLAIGHWLLESEAFSFLNPEGFPNSLAWFLRGF